jgi:hypothetical protein
MPTKAFEIKTVRLLEFKATDKGEVEACVATLGVVDRDGDYMRPGCIKSGSKVIMSDYGHSSIIGGQRPVGKGVINVVGDKAMFKGQVFMDTLDGQEAFKTLRHMGDDQEWSFGFQVLTASKPSDDERKAGAYRSLDKLDSFEVSPVFMGAGLGTMTTSIKSQADGHTPGIEERLERLEQGFGRLEAKIAKRDDVDPKEGADKYGDVPFADPKNNKYPIDTEEHIRAAWSYINHPDESSKYSAEDLATIKERIVAAWKDKIDKAGPPSASTEKSADVTEIERKRIADGAAAEFDRFARSRRST